MNNIYHQGSFDGSCFLYSIVNSYSALMSKSPTQDMWNKAIKWIPFSGDFVTTTGTERYDDDLNLYDFTIKRILREFKLGSKIEVSMHASISGVEHLKSLISDTSVVLLNIDGGHWVSVVDYSDKQLMIACSSERNSPDGHYLEHTSEQFSRKYNLKKNIGKLKSIYQPSVIQFKSSDV